MGLFTSKAEKEAMERCRQRKIENEALTAENARLKDELAEARRAANPDALAAASLRDEVQQLKEQRATLQQDLVRQGEELRVLGAECDAKRDELVQLDDTILLQEFGLYQPLYEFSSSDRYKEELARVRDLQKAMVRDKTAATCSTNWTVNGDSRKGARMTADNIKQILRAFNLECDLIVDHVKYNNIESMERRLRQSFDGLNRLNVTHSIQISEAYYDLKVAELRLAVEWAQKKQEEKEEMQRIREEQREEAKAAKELEERRREIEKERGHYANALKKLERQIVDAGGDDLEALEERRREIETELGDLDLALRDVDYREANMRAGYVYIISNVGSFGEDVYKIGMTRRLDPMERVAELGDASVPFGFDVHAMIFSDDAPRLEAALHRAFERRRVNMINTRREFFRVSLEEIEQEVRANHDKTVDFVRVAEAAQYRMSQRVAEGKI